MTIPTTEPIETLRQRAADLRLGLHVDPHAKRRGEPHIVIFRAGMTVKQFKCIDEAGSWLTSGFGQVLARSRLTNRREPARGEPIPAAGNHSGTV